MPKAKTPVQKPMFTIQDLSCGTPEAQIQIATYLASQSPAQVQTITAFIAMLKSGAAISCGYKRCFHYLKEYFKNVPTEVRLT